MLAVCIVLRLQRATKSPVRPSGFPGMSSITTTLLLLRIYILVLNNPSTSIFLFPDLRLTWYKGDAGRAKYLAPSTEDKNGRLIKF